MPWAPPLPWAPSGLPHFPPQSVGPGRRFNMGYWDLASLSVCLSLTLSLTLFGDKQGLYPSPLPHKYTNPLLFKASTLFVVFPAALFVVLSSLCSQPPPKRNISLRVEKRTIPGSISKPPTTGWEQNYSQFHLNASPYSLTQEYSQFHLNISPCTTRI